VVAAAGDGGAIAAEEGPVLRAPVVEPKAVFGDDGLADFFEGGGSEVGRVNAELAGEFGGKENMPSRGDLEAVVRDAGDAGEIDDGQAKAANGASIIGEQQILFRQIREQAANRFKAGRDHQKEARSLVCETKESYEQVLSDTGFGEINFRDDSKFFITYAKELLQRLANNKNFIKQEYGEALFLTIQKQHEDLIDNINQCKKFATRIVAKKMT